MEKELLGIGYLKTKLMNKKTRVLERYSYYNQKYRVQDFNISTPPDLRWQQVRLGWCTKAVDSLADRLIFKEFDNDNFDMNAIFNANNPDTFFSSAILSSLISSCCFVYISKDDEGYPRLQVIDGANATGIIDERTGLLTEGYAVLDTDEYGKPISEAYFTSEYTEYYELGAEPYQIPNPTGYPLLVPIVYKPSDTKPFGHSRITQACMDIIQCASRTMKRAEISGEFYSYPQKYIVGLSSESEPIEKWKASMSSMLAIYKDEDGDTPKLGQFQQQSMTPHLDQVQMYVKQFCGETGLTADDLGFISSNPSSAESIKASHETLRLLCRKAQRTFGRGFLNVGFVAACLRDDYQYIRRVMYLTTPVWETIFEPDSATLSAIGDGAIKINQAVPNYFNKDNLELLTGIKASDDEPIIGGE